LGYGRWALGRGLELKVKAKETCVRGSYVAAGLQTRPLPSGLKTRRHVRGLSPIAYRP